MTQSLALIGRSGGGGGGGAKEVTVEVRTLLRVPRKSSTSTTFLRCRCGATPIAQMSRETRLLFPEAEEKQSSNVWSKSARIRNKAGHSGLRKPNLHSVSQLSRKQDISKKSEMESMQQYLRDGKEDVGSDYESKQGYHRRRERILSNSERYSASLPL